MVGEATSPGTISYNRLLPPRMAAGVSFLAFSAMKTGYQTTFEPVVIIMLDCRNVVIRIKISFSFLINFLNFIP